MDKQWNQYLEWRTENGYTGLSTDEQYREFLAAVDQPTETEKLSRVEAKELEEQFEDVTVKENVQTTFNAIKLIATVGGEITYSDMAKLTGFSLRTVKNHVEELANKGYLQVKRGAHANSYYWGTDMRQLNKPKKNIHFVETFEWVQAKEDTVREITIKDAISETHVTTYNLENLLDRTGEFLREADGTCLLRDEMSRMYQ
ncbi:winged helix-turn-helix domain-containing protein [Bacillus thuringiensis]|uniref:helix-turn-helix transcriptional regulator n=1 Tax=Bacillus thuringiensis TaxID=1428 RepID=UPI000BF5086C|nr:winged helix-turn-helix domain-containing protein [Bacillus thuringiensis]PFD91636.1 winged helix-turn-helix domain-containing protein [Bacillus thuringiensis]